MIKSFGDVSKPLEFDNFEKTGGSAEGGTTSEHIDTAPADKADSPQTDEAGLYVPPKSEEYEWIWKVRRIPITDFSSCGAHFEIAGIGDISADIFPLTGRVLLVYRAMLFVA